MGSRSGETAFYASARQPLRSILAQTGVSIIEADDELCLCFHVSWRKVLNYIRVHKIRTPSQLHECGGAGTGCGWCRKQLERLTHLCAENPPSPDTIDEWLRHQTPNKKKYSEGREVYRAEKDSVGDATIPANPPSASPNPPDPPVDPDIPPSNAE